MTDRTNHCTHCVTLAAERDEALEHLRKIEAATKGHTADGTPHGEPYCCCPLCDVVRESDLDEFLAKHQPPSCERCGDKREVVMPEGGGVRTRYMAPCPDCAPCGRCGGAKELFWEEDDPEVEATIQHRAPCPDCAEDSDAI